MSHSGLAAVDAVTRTRRADVDWLRVVAMLAVFLVHVAQVYTPWQVWHIQSAERSELLGEIAVLVWPWALPLFMLLAGSGTYYSLGRRSNREYLRERTLRLLVPLLVGTLVVVPPQIYVERLSQGRFAGSYLEFYPSFFQGLYPEGNFAAGHLWFLAYLYAYSVIMLPVLRWIRDGEADILLEAFDRFCRQAGGLLLLGVPVVATQIALRGRFPRSLTFFDDWAEHALLLAAFLLGFLVSARAAIANALMEQWRLCVAPAVISTIGLAAYAWTTTRPDVIPEGYNGTYVAFWSAFGIAGWCWLLVLVGASRAFIRRRTPLLSYASESIYPFYVFHQTAIVVLAYFVVQWRLGIGWGFGVLLVSSFVVTLTLTEAIRRFPAARGLFGFRAKRNVRAAPRP